ncbi:MAG TPA: adenylate/guanylate cyclase domain-containing protein [Rudaea sp.]|nr:adenylate/guanylate cyclase domain-containing protein [Rudaea sp.]
MNSVVSRARGLFGTSTPQPQRVTEEIARSQRESETWVSGAQIAVIAAALLAYTFTPRGFSPDTPIAALPLGIVALILLIGLRAWFAFSGQLSRPVLAASVVAEMTVLLGLLWGFAPQYETTLAVALKNSLFVAIFVLIALRALRFEPIWVWLSGLTAALGWTLLAVFAWREAGAGGQTMDFVVAATTGRIDAHDEIIRIAVILIVTAVLATALARARLTLARAVQASQSADALSRFFDSEVADQITTTDLPPMAGQSMAREAAIMFTDLRGFTKASATLSAAELIALIAEYQNVVLPVVRAHGGNIDKFMGDGILASFGAVRASTTYAADALRCIDAILATSRAWAQDRQTRSLPALGIGIGVAHGPLVFGIIGVERRLEYTVIGETVNLAAKLEKHNKAEAAAACAPASLITLARLQDPALSPEGFEIRVTRTVAGTAEPLDLAVWPAV